MVSSSVQEEKICGKLNCSSLYYRAKSESVPSKGIGHRDEMSRCILMQETDDTIKGDLYSSRSVSSKVMHY